MEINTILFILDDNYNHSDLSTDAETINYFDLHV